MGLTVTANELHIRITAVEKCCLLCSSKPDSIFCDLPQAALLELASLRQVTVYPKGSRIFQEGDRPKGIYCIGAGQVKLSRSSPDGRDVVLGLASMGDVLGVRPLLTGSPHDVTAETTVETRVCLVPRQDFLNFLRRNAPVSLRLAEKLSLYLGHAYEHVCGVVLKPAAERLAGVLLDLCQKQGWPDRGGASLMVQLGQEELAALAGVSRRSLNRALATLRASGLIECRRRCIIIHNPAALRSRLAS